MYRHLSIFFLVTTFVVAPLIIAQQQDDTFRSDTRLVVLHASVVDKDGRLLTELQFRDRLQVRRQPQRLYAHRVR